MLPRNRAKLGLSIPTDPRYRGFDALTSPSTSPSAAAAGLTSPSRRRQQQQQLLQRLIPPPPPTPIRRNMPHRNRAKLGLSIPIDPGYRGFDSLTSPSTSSSSTCLPSPSKRRPQQPLSRPIPPPPPTPIMMETPKLEKEEAEELENLVHAPPFGRSNNNKKLSKQLSLRETSRDIAWEKRRREIFRQEKRRNSVSADTTPDAASPRELKDADLHELKGCIELGFGFNEEEGQTLCNTLPALDLYFAVNRKLSLSPVTTPHLTSSTSLDSPRSEESWKICGPGDDPQQVKTKLRHWAQAVACSVMQTL